MCVCVWVGNLCVGVCVCGLVTCVLVGVCVGVGKLCVGVCWL